jgi:tetratricopeptide (TPR) repeat protein
MWIKHYERGKDALRHRRFREAMRHFRKAKETVEIETNPLLAGALYMRASGTEMACHQMEAALASAKRAVEIAEKHVADLEGQKLLVSSITVLACVTAAGSDTDTEAVHMLGDLIARVATFDAPELAAEPLEALADLHLTRRDYLEAERLYTQAYRLRDKSDPIGDKTLAALDRIIEVCDLNHHRDEADRFTQLRTERIKKRIISSGDPHGLEVVRENDRLQEAKKKILGKSVIDDAVQSAMAPLGQNRHSIPPIML